MAALPGASSRTLGRYELIQELAKSQLGALWVAFVPGGDEQLVAIRRVNTGAPVTAEDKDALSEGAWWTLELSHPRIARGIDVVMSDSELGIVSEYHEGEVLRSLLRLASFKRKPVPVTVALRIASDVLEALAEAESQAQPLSGGQSSYATGGLVPDSVLVGSDGVARLLDVGIAGASSSVSNVARNPEMVSYFSPEQIAGTRLDIRSNVYSVGVMLWEMLAGKRLYVGSTYTAVTERIQSGHPPRLDASKPVGGDPIPSAVADVVARALSSDPAARYASPRELIEAIAAAQEPATQAEVAALVDDLAGNTLATRRKVIDRARNPAQAAKSLIGAARAAAKSAPDLGRAPAKSAPDLGRAPAKSAPDLGRAPAKSAPDLGRARSATKPGVAPPPPRERKQTLLGIAPAPQPPPVLRDEPDAIDSIDSIDSAELESISKVEAIPVAPTESALVGALTRDSADAAKTDDADAPGTHIKTQVLGTPVQAEEVEEPPISLEPLSEVESVKPEPPARPQPPARERAASKPDGEDAKEDGDSERSSGDSAVAWLGPPPGVALDDDLDAPVPSRVDPAKKSKLTMIVGGIVAGAAVVLVVAMAVGGKPDETSDPAPAANTSEPEPKPTTAKVEPPKPEPEPPKEEPKPEATEEEPAPEETAKSEPEPEPEPEAKPEPAPKPKPVSRPATTWKPRPTQPKPKPKYTPSGI